MGLWTDKLTFTPTASGATRITVNGQAVSSGHASQSLTLDLGSNLVSLVVDAKGTSRTYTVDVQRARGVIDYLKASNTGSNDDFGWSVSLSGDTLAVGAFGEDSAATGVGGDEINNSAKSSGAAYIFTRAAGGSWHQEAYLKASNTDANDFFGRSVSLWGNTLAVGSNDEDSAATGVGGDPSDNSSESGAVYVFH